MKSFPLFAALVGALLLPTPAVRAQNGDFAAAVREHRRPRLVVVISIDQFRADYLRRLTDLYLPPMNGKTVGGFRYLMTRGAYFVDARYGHFPLYTGPGHAVILTGGYPYKTGIVGNDWWSKTASAPVYCVDDARQKVVGAAAGSTAKPMGPLNLHSSTVGDELKLASGGESKVITISLKDRAAILLGGHAQDASVWFDTAGGRWISSTAFCKTGKLPTWADAINAQAIPDKSLGATWNLSVPLAALSGRGFQPDLGPNQNPGGLGLRFPHHVGAEKNKANYGAFTLTPAANDYVFATAEAAVSAEKLGQRGDSPDLLALNLATNDYVGHAFGPYSPEALDVAVQTDRALSGFLNYLQRTVPGGLSQVAFAVTADHGVAPNPEDSVDRNLFAGRVPEAGVTKAMSDALSAQFGADTWLAQGADGKPSGLVDGVYLYLSEDAVTRALQSGKATSRAQIEDTAAAAVATVSGIYACYTRHQIMTGALPRTELASHIGNGFDPAVAGDLVVIISPFYEGGTLGVSSGTTHGTPYIYDTHVPLLLTGFGVTPGVYSDPVSIADLAPTLCSLLGIEYPSGCDGVLLRQALK